MSPIGEALKDCRPVVSFSLADLSDGATEDERSGDEAGAVPLSEYARALVRRLEALDTPACVIGWSTGGIVAIEAAAHSPHRVAGLVLLSATARFCSVPSSERDNGYTSGVDPVTLKAMIRKLKREPEDVLADFISTAAAPMTIPAPELAARVQNALQPGKDFLVHGLEYLARTDLRGVLHSIGSPCLIVHGGGDAIIPPAAARFLDSNLPRSTFELLPSAGHLLVEQCGKDLMNRISQFVESL